jgi:acyl-CoA reductase-like NAD-dependent aldehyde dehydrogenase
VSKLRPEPKPIVSAQGFDPVPPTPHAEVESVLRSLDARAAEWAAMSPKDRAKLLRSCIPCFLNVAEKAATAATRHKGSYGYGIGEEL